MSINLQQLNDYIVTPTLKELGYYSLSARNLLLGTAAQESQLGTYIHQINGNALGIYEMKPKTHKDIWENYLNYNPKLSEQIIKMIIDKTVFAYEMMFNLKYATAMCRIHYLRVPEKLPAHDNIYQLARYWKQYYNTLEGKGWAQQFIDNYKMFEIDKLGEN